MANIGLSSSSKNDLADENLPCQSSSLHTISYMTPSTYYMHEFLKCHPLYLSHEWIVTTGE